MSGSDMPRARQARRDRVEPVVVDERARRAEDRDRELERGEEDECLKRPRARAQPAAEQAAEAQARHERRHDHRHRVKADAAVQSQHALPGDLVDERGGAAQQEQEAREKGAPRLRRRHDGASAWERLR